MLRAIKRMIARTHPADAILWLGAAAVLALWLVSGPL